MRFIFVAFSFLARFKCVFSYPGWECEGWMSFRFFLLYVHLINVRETAERHHPKRVHNDVVAQNDEIEFWCSQRACDLWLNTFAWRQQELRAPWFKIPNEICLCLHSKWITFSELCLFSYFAPFYSFAFVFNWVKIT